MISQAWLGDFLLATFRAATPLAFAALGVLLSERAGVLNIGVEGAMLTGALAAVMAGVLTGSAWAGLVVGLLIGLVGGIILAYLTVVLPADQVVAGIGFNIVSLGVTSFIYKIMVGRGVRLIGPDAFSSLAPHLKQVPIAGFFASISPLTYVALGVTVLMYFFLFRSGPGLLWRSSGENAHAAHAAGISVSRVRLAAIVGGMVLASLGGASLTLAWVHSFTDNITMGRGFIALAAVYFGRWHPMWALGASLLFGAGEALAFRAQAAGVGLNPYFYMMVPYVLTLLAVAFMGRAVGPRDAGKPYVRG